MDQLWTRSIVWCSFPMVLQGLRNAGRHSPCNEIAASPAFCNIWDISPLLLGWVWHFKWLPRGTCWMLWICRSVPHVGNTLKFSVHVIWRVECDSVPFRLLEDLKEFPTLVWLHYGSSQASVSKVDKCVWTQCHWSKIKIYWSKFSFSQKVWTSPLSICN